MEMETKYGDGPAARAMERQDRVADMVARAISLLVSHPDMEKGGDAMWFIVEAIDGLRSIDRRKV